MLRLAKMHWPCIWSPTYPIGERDHLQCPYLGSGPLWQLRELCFCLLLAVEVNYFTQVVQYILDLNDNRFSDAVIRQFAGNVCALSVQKFSSNVIEKVSCIVTFYLFLCSQIFCSVSVLLNTAPVRCSLKSCWIELVSKSCCGIRMAIIVFRCVAITVLF